MPPIGAIVLADRCVLHAQGRTGVDWHLKPFVAWGAGSACVFALENLMGGLSTAVSAAVAAAACSYAMACADAPEAAAPAT